MTHAAVAQSLAMGSLHHTLSTRVASGEPRIKALLHCIAVRSSA